MKRLALVLICIFVFAGQSLAADRADCRSLDQKAAAIAALIMGGAENLPANKDRFDKYPNLQKFAVHTKGNDWWVMYEHKHIALASGWLCKDNPPEDAKIFETVKRR